MGNHARHRGAHPQDIQLFAEPSVPALRSATGDLSWLLTGGYAMPSALKLVGDRYSLVARQRLAVARCACGDRERDRRLRHRVPVAELQSEALWIDGFNVLTSLEAALSGGVVLRGRDECWRDMASVHGTYRRVDETTPALQLIGELLSQWEVAQVLWLFDRPVSNSGRVATVLRELAAEHNWPWEVQLVQNPDSVLASSERIVASADSQVINLADRWFNLVSEALKARIPSAWRVDLSS